MRVRRTTLAACLVVAMAAAGCAGSSSEETSASPAPSPGSTPTSAATSAALPAPPKVGSCHDLDVQAATDPVDASTPVPCRGRHTTVTIKVGRIAGVQDGHLLAVDSAAVRRQVDRACPRTLGGFVGGSRTDQRLSRLQVVPFSPSLEQADAGADWFRCDLLGVRSEGRLIHLPPRMRGALDKPGALDRFGTCGTAAPGSKTFARVVCSDKHRWRAVSDIAISGSAYLGKTASAKGDAACKDIASARANGALKFSWSFEWPTRAQWRDGQRWGLCWLPEG